jgi:hypothetical protein
LLPRDELIEPLEQVYGARVYEWYAPIARFAIQRDERRPWRSVFEVLPEDFTKFHWRILVQRDTRVHR